MSMNRFVRTNGTPRGRERGLVCTAFIHNGNFYGTELEIYEDGAVECWAMVDLAFLEKKFKQGWIAATVPTGETISFHDLGQWKVADAQWVIDQKSLRQQLLDMLRQLNPQMQGLVDFQGSDVELRDGVRWSKMGLSNGTPITGTSESPIPGDSTWAFIREGDLFHVTAIRIYANGKVDIDPWLGHETLVDHTELPGLLRSRKLTLRVADGKWISIDGLGKCQVADGWWQRTRKDFLGQIQDILDKLNGRKGAVERCRDAFNEYLANPGRESKERLRIAYEAVPEHHRMYCGDMDTKDTPIRMVLYGRSEIEGWSHRAVARGLGETDLPDIDVPIIDE